MIIHKENDTSKAVCEKCNKIVSTTFHYADFAFNNYRIPNILQGFCDICGESVSLPHQSTFKIKEYRDTHNHPFELRVPLHYTDILLAIGQAHKVSQKPNSLCRIVSEHYLSKMSKPEGLNIRKRIILALDEDLAKGESNDRLSCVFPDSIFSILKFIANDEKKKQAAIVKGIIVAAKHDLLDDSKSKFAKEFEDLAVARL
jgi:hypothetical protein